MHAVIRMREYESTVDRRCFIGSIGAQQGAFCVGGGWAAEAAENNATCRGVVVTNPQLIAGASLGASAPMVAVRDAAVISIFKKIGRLL